MTRSRYLTAPPTTYRMKTVILSVYFNIKMTIRHYDAYQSVSVAVGAKLPCQREGANSEDLFAVVVMTGELIVGCGKFMQFARWFYEQQFSGSTAQTHCARLPQLVSKKFLEEEIFVETNFCKLAFNHENRENFCLAKVSRYTVKVTDLGRCHLYWQDTYHYPFVCSTVLSRASAHTRVSAHPPVLTVLWFLGFSV